MNESTKTISDLGHHRNSQRHDADDAVIDLPFVRLFDEPKLVHLLADLILVAAKKTRGLCERIAEFE